MVPQVLPMQSFPEALAAMSAADKALFFYEQGGEPVSRALAVFSGAISLMTGPEGGLTEQEVSRAHAAGMAVCSLGPRILRCETAPLCALSAVMYASGEF